MGLPLRAALARDGRLARLAPGLALALGVFAYRPLFLNSIRVPEAYVVERWFFASDEKSPLLVIAIAAWLLWRRRARWRALPARCDRGTTAVLLALGTALFAWAQLARAADLLLPSLAANALAVAAATRGRPGCRAVLLPALVLLLAVPIPAPIRDELVWRLQGWTARGAASTMQLLGLDVVREGIVFRRGEQSFLVIDACSGLRGIENLVLMAILVRELFAESGARQWLLLLVAPALGFALNLVRVVLIAVSSDPQALAGQADHTPQGVAIMLVGTAILYALGWGMAQRGGPVDAAPAASPPDADDGTPATAWAVAALWLAALATVSLAAPSLSAVEGGRPPEIPFPAEAAGWSSEELTPEVHFIGPMPWRGSLYRHYEREQRHGPPQIVELFVGFEVPGHRISSRLFTSKLELPGGAWTREESRTSRVWLLGRDAQLSLASRASGTRHALVYTWRLRDQGLWRETARSLLALDAGPFRRERRRAVVRLVTPMAGPGATARERAKRTLDLFIGDFRDALAAL